jgi:crotonobetainyl-CoA:carnitine CoA-transferase CaiB-like acyl-CoA transferase
VILQGVRLLELASGISGPLAGLRLGELGAEVTKVELHPGDWMRDASPRAPESADSAAFVSLNRGKRFFGLGPSLDLAEPLLERLVQRSDVVVTDWTESELDTAGLLGIREAAALGSSELIWVEMSDFGRVGPLTDHAGSELVLQAAAGYTRWLGEFGKPATRLGADVAGAATGIMACQAVLAALYWQRKGGTGQRVELARLGALLGMKSIHLAAQTDPDEFSGPRVGGANYPPERGYRTGDGALTFAFGGAVGEVGRSGWLNFIHEIGLDWMKDDPRFRDDTTGRLTTGLGPEARGLRVEYEREFEHHKASEIVDLVRNNGGLAAEFESHQTVLSSEQLTELEAVREVHDGAQTRRVMAFPARFSTGRVDALEGVSRVGADTRTIALELGYEPSDINEFISRGALAEGSREDMTL